MPPADRVRASHALKLRTERPDLSWAAVAAATGYADRDSCRVAVERERRRRAQEDEARKVWG